MILVSTSVLLFAELHYVSIKCLYFWLMNVTYILVRDCMSSQELVDFVHEQLKLVRRDSLLCKNACSILVINCNCLCFVQQSKLSVICERVLDNCLAPSAGGEGCDNMTLILIQLKKPATSTSWH